MVRLLPSCIALFILWPHSVLYNYICCIESFFHDLATYPSVTDINAFPTYVIAEQVSLFLMEMLLLFEVRSVFTYPWDPIIEATLCPMYKYVVFLLPLILHEIQTAHRKSGYTCATKNGCDQGRSRLSKTLYISRPKHRVLDVPSASPSSRLVPDGPIGFSVRNYRVPDGFIGFPESNGVISIEAPHYRHTPAQ